MKYAILILLSGLAIIGFLNSKDIRDCVRIGNTYDYCVKVFHP